MFAAQNPSRLRFCGILCSLLCVPLTSWNVLLCWGNIGGEWELMIPFCADISVWVLKLWILLFGYLAFTVNEKWFFRVFCFLRELHSPPPLCEFEFDSIKEGERERFANWHILKVWVTQYVIWITFHLFCYFKVLIHIHKRFATRNFAVCIKLKW